MEVCGGRKGAGCEFGEDVVRRGEWGLGAGGVRRGFEELEWCWGCEKRDARGCFSSSSSCVLLLLDMELIGCGDN